MSSATCARRCSTPPRSPPAPGLDAGCANGLAHANPLAPEVRRGAGQAGAAEQGRGVPPSLLALPGTDALPGAKGAAAARAGRRPLRLPAGRALEGAPLGAADAG